MSNVVKDYLDKYPNLPTRTIAKKIYSENNLKYKNIESVRTLVRIYRGTTGEKMLKELKTDKYLTADKRIEKYNIPQSIVQEYEPYYITGNKGLIFADVHIPFHDTDAIKCMFDHTCSDKYDFILLNGDIMDCFDISHFEKEPNVMRFNDERNMTKDFLKELKRVYPGAKIYYKFGNHEKRFESYLMSKAPEIFDCEEFRLEILLDLFNLGIKHIEEDRYIDISGLSVLHAHEYKGGITSPANPARTTFLRTKSTSLVAHHHQSSEHTESAINGKIITCWSIGCLCGLHPKWMPLNKWNTGFAIYEREKDDFWTIKNKRIISNRVV